MARSQWIQQGQMHQWRVEARKQGGGAEDVYKENLKCFSKTTFQNFNIPIVIFRKRPLFLRFTF